MAQSRYITMQGDPIDGNLITKFAKAADFPAAVGQVGLTYVFQDALKGPVKADTSESEIVMSMVLSAGIIALFQTTAWRMFEKTRASMASLQDKCIDTKPDRNTPPTTAKYGIKAEQLRSYYKTMGILGGILDSGFIIYNGVSDPGNFGRHALTQALNSMVFYTRMITGYQRFDKVIKGEWQIIDIPTPEKVAEAKEAEQKKPALLPVPTAG